MSMPTRENALIVFAKRPEPGRVKTRLTQVLSPVEAARLYEAFLHDALRQYLALRADVRLYLTGGSLPDGVVPPGVSIHVQQGEGLGPRMQRAFVETFAAGYERAVIIGTDHPTLPSAFVEQAFSALHVPRAVSLGPSDDGGYYLLGMNDFFPALFSEMHYSHDGVFDQTLDRAAATDAALTVLPPWYDVDTPEALVRLIEDLAATPGAAPQTRAVMRALARRHPGLVAENS